MTDENSDDDEVEVEVDELTSPMAGMFGNLFDNTFSGDIDEAPSEETQIGIRLMKAGAAMHDFVDYAEEHDLNIAEMSQQEIMDLDHEDKMVVYGFMAMSSGMQEMGEFLDDDDDDNPFKVSDGDDPIY